MDKDMDKDKEQRLIKHMASCTHPIERAQRDSAVAIRRIRQLLEKDVKALCPNDAEEMMRLLDISDGVLKYQLEWLEYLLGISHKNGLEMPGTQQAAYSVIDLRAKLTDVRLAIMNWVRAFEGWPTEAERLEMMMSLPSPEEVEAEQLEAYRTGGASLLPKQGSLNDGGSLT